MESFGQSFWNGYVSSTHSSDEAESLVLGIDFGSSNSSVAVWRADKNKVKIIRNSSLPASKTTPSLIQFNQTFNGYKVGNECDASMDHVISNLKSLLLHPEAEIAAVLDDHVSSHSAWVDGTTLKCFDRPAVHTKGEAEKRPGKTVPVEVLVGFLLSYLKECAEMYLTRRPIKQVNVIDGSQVETTTNYTAPPASTTSSVKTKKEDTPGSALRVEVTRVVLGVPVNCTERSKQSLKKAAHLAGFTDVHFLAESTAAATAYGLTVSGTKNALIFDMGGGTTDLSIMHIQNGTLTVQCTGGNNVLGGKNIDAALLELVERKLESLQDKQRQIVQALGRTHLLQLCRNCKEELSTVDKSTITIPKTPCDGSATACISIEISRVEFEAAAKPITDLVEATVLHTVQGWQLQQKQQQEQKNASAGAETEEEEEADGFVRVSPVASLPPASDNEANNVPPSDRMAESLVVKPTSTADAANEGSTFTIDEVVLVGGSSRVPCVRAALRRGLGKAGIAAFAPDGPKELCTSLNPEEVVAEGLAVRGAVLSGISTGKLKELLMMDCVNNAIGVMTWEAEKNTTTALSANSTNSDIPGTRIFNCILHKGMAIPAKNTLRFPLADANQKFVSLDIFEEVEECKLKRDTVADAGQETHESSDYEMVYTYYVVATADIAIPATSGDSHGSGAVDIAFTMTTDGMLQFTVVRVSDAGNNEASTAKVNVASFNMLIGYIVVMFALYLFVKMALTEPDVVGSNDRALVDAVVPSASNIAEGLQNSGSHVITDSLADSGFDSVMSAAVDAVGNNVPV